VHSDHRIPAHYLSIMIHTRRSFLQRIKERGKDELTPQKKKDFEWTRSNVSVDDNDSFVRESTTESRDELIACPPIQSRNSAQDAAEALGQDLEDMGYNLDCKSFISKGTVESDSVIERYQPPRKLKPRSSAKPSVTPPPERDIIMAMRSMVSTAPSTTRGVFEDADDQQASFRNEKISGPSKDNSERSQEKPDWDNNGGAATQDGNSSSGSRNENDPTNQSGPDTTRMSRLELVKTRNTDDVSSSLPRSGSVPYPRSYSFGSLKKIATVRAAHSWNVSSIPSSLHRIPSSSDADGDEDDEAMENKEEQILTVTSTISRSGHSRPTSIESPPVPYTLELPVKQQHIKHVDIPKTPVLIEGMNFVKNSTLAPDSTRNFKLSPRTRLARAKLRQTIQESMEQNQDMEITSAKSAPAMQMSHVFVKKVKTSRLVVNEDLKVDEVPALEDVTSNNDEVAQEIKPIIYEDIEKDKRVENEMADVPRPQLIPIETSPIAATTKADASSPELKSEESLAKKHGNIIPATTATIKLKSPKKLKASTNPAEPVRIFRLLSVFRKPLLSPKKTRKPITKAPEPTMKAPEPIRQPASETSNHSEAQEDDEVSKDNCAYVGYDIETRDGVEVVAVAKMLPYVALSSPASSKKPLSPRPRNASNHSAKPAYHSKQEMKRDVEVATTPQSDINAPSDAEATVQEFKGGQGSNSLSPRKNGIDTEEKAHWNIRSFFFNPVPQMGKPMKHLTSDPDVGCFESTEKAHEGRKDSGIDAARNAGEDRLCTKQDTKKTSSSKKPQYSDSRLTNAARVENISHCDLLDAATKENALAKDGTQENDPVATVTKNGISHDFVADAESKPKRKSSFRIGFKGFRKTTVCEVKVPGPPQDRHEIIQDFLDREMKGQEEHSFPSKLDPTKNAHGAGLLHDMMIQNSQIPKHLIISKLDDSSCLTTETDKKKASWLEAVVSPSALDAAVWDEIAEAGAIVERAIEKLEEATKAGDLSTKASSTLSEDIEKALLTLKKHADRLGVTETDLLLAVKSTDGGESEANPKSGQTPTHTSSASYSTGQTPPLVFGQELFESIKVYLFNK
jgi:hypothetical protein